MTTDLETPRLTLAGVELQDWIAYQSIFAAPATAEYSIVVKHPGHERAQAFVRWMVALGKKSVGFGWMIRARETHSLVGCIRLNRIDRRHSMASVGYELDERFWGCGFATEALRAVVTHCHDTLGLNRVEAWTADGNTASDRVLTRVGFQCEGLQRQRLEIRGSRYGMRLFGRLATDAGEWGGEAWR